MINKQKQAPMIPTLTGRGHNGSNKLTSKELMDHAFMAYIQDLISTNFSAEKLHQFLNDFQVLPRENDPFTDAEIETVLLQHSILSSDDVNPDRLLGVVEPEYGQGIDFFFLNLEQDNDIRSEYYLGSTSLSDES